MKKIKIVEVGPRDGLQNELIHLDPKVRIQFVKKLSQAGLKHIEVGAFVSPKWVPQMIGSDKILKSLNKSCPKNNFSVLVPNLKGMEGALKNGAREIAVFGACSEAFSKKNINCSIEESFLRFRKVITLAKKNNIKVRGYLSTAFGCPYQGVVKVSDVVKYTKKMFSLGVYEVSIGDTIGVATPKQIEKLLRAFVKAKLPLNKVALHLHDTRGTALANVLMGLQMGVQIFDSSLAGLGGCPYAKGASGNLATEDLVYMLHGMGYKTEVDLKKLVKLKPWVESQVQRNLPSRVGQSGLPLKPVY